MLLKKKTNEVITLQLVIQTKLFKQSWHSSIFFPIRKVNFWALKTEVKKLKSSLPIVWGWGKIYMHCKEHIFPKQLMRSFKVSSFQLISDPNLFRELLFISSKLSQNSLSSTRITLSCFGKMWQSTFLNVTSAELFVK